ncbi:MAG: GumC family protein [Opitutaceae bacterium]
MNFPDDTHSSNRLAQDPARSGNGNTNGHANGHTNGIGASARALLPGLMPGDAAKTKSAGRAGDLSFEEAVALFRKGVAIVRSRWINGIAAALIVGGGIGYMLMTKRPEYTAVTSMLAQSALDEILKTEVGVGLNAQDQENALRNHLSVMESRRFTVAITEEFTDEEIASVMEPYLKSEDKPTRAAFELFVAGRLGVDRERGREFFVLSFHHADPEIAVMVADRISAAYLKLVQKEFRNANLAASEILRRQAEDLQDEISAIEDQRRDYRKEHNIISVEENQGILAERLRRIDQKRSDIRIQRVQLEAQVAAAERDIAATPMPFDNPLLAGFGNNQQLRQELDRLIAQREVLASRYGSKHPKMRDIDANIRGVEENIAKNFELAFRDLKSQYETSLTIENQLEAEFTEAFGAGIEIEKLANRYLVLGSEVSTKRETLFELLRRVNKAGVVSQLPADVMRVVDPAFIQKPRLPKKLVYAGMAGFMAAAAFIGVPLLLHLFDERIKSATDVEKVLGKELLGGIPRLANIRTEDRAQVVRDNVDPANVEALMSIVAQLDLASKKSSQKSFLVTSTVPGEGKSTVVSNLAAGFTRLGKRTIIFDCDYRRPTQHTLHRATNKTGFLAWARAGFPQDAVFEPEGLLGLCELSDGTRLIPAGGDDPQPTQYLVAKPTAWLFDQLKSRYDIILIDTPPAGLFQDALVLSRFAQETLLVAREARAPVTQIRRTISDIDKTQAPVLGIILNDFSSHSLNPRLAHGYSYGQYGYAAAAARTANARAAAPAA